MIEFYDYILLDNTRILFKETQKEIKVKLLFLSECNKSVDLMKEVI